MPISPVSIRNNVKTSIATLVVLAIGLLILGPILAIWSLNTLFPALAIPYTLETWVAAVILTGIVKTTVSTNK